MRGGEGASARGARAARMLARQSSECSSSSSAGGAGGGVHRVAALTAKGLVGDKILWHVLRAQRDWGEEGGGGAGGEAHAAAGGRALPAHTISLPCPTNPPESLPMARASAWAKKLHMSSSWLDTTSP